MVAQDGARLAPRVTRLARRVARAGPSLSDWMEIDH
jgi:hypothetical protein